MKNFCLTVIACISAYTISYSEPNFAGSWSGYITQKSTVALASNYHFSLFLEVNGDEVAGHSEIRMWDEPEVFAEMVLEGSISDVTIQLKENEIVQQKIYSYAYWCLKTLHMQYSVENGMEMLKGNWNSDLCTGPGEIYLERTPSS